MKRIDHDPRTEELLIERALRPLDQGEHAELAANGADADDSYDLAAAAAVVATTPLQPMPAGLIDRLLPAEDFTRTVPGTAFDFRTTLPGVVVPPPARPSAPVPADAIPTPVEAIPIEKAREKRRRRVSPAWFAAAACAAIAIGVVWWSRTQPGAPQSPLSPTEARAELLRSAKDVTTIAWTATGDPAAHGASGDVVWSASQQRGYMRFHGLAANDPRITQYQLWIFDKDRDDKFPVDGGVFDVTSGDVIVPITAKLRVDEPTLFAVTVEKPGGVVVSKRERIVVTAARG